jgi:hypothetical protein
MAHFIKLNQIDPEHDSSVTYTPILFNLDTVISIEPSHAGKHSRITTRWTSGPGIRVQESLEEIQKLISA